ncbi:MAG: hypothetical protein HQ504_13740 [Rhodospirillaceae bacterium]|nr:hypothetical protein [Rhodospirillaceae bacterium]
MNDYISNFIQHSGQIDSFLSSAALWIGFAAIGSLFIGRNQARETAPFLGWAFVSLFFTVFGVLTKIPFTFLAVSMAILALAAGAYAIYRKQGVFPTGTMKMVLVAGPLLLLVSAMVGSQWDEFSTWLITPRFLLETDVFPNKDNVHKSGALAAYPFSWHYISYLASRIGGRFMENAGALVNVFMLLTFGLVAVRLIRDGLGRKDEDSSGGWGLYALGGLLATVLSTTFAQKVALTSYADVATAVILGMGGVIGWTMLEALTEDRKDDAKRQAMQIGLLMMLLVNLKQSTVVLFVILIIAIVLTGLRDPRIKFSKLARTLPWMIIPSVVIFVLWRYYISIELPTSEMKIMPVSEWLFEYIPQILQRMLLVLTKKGAFLVLLIVIVGFGARAMFRFRTPFDRLALLVALVFLGHNAFLFFAYVSTFGKFDALRAASYWRYNMQLGMLGVAFMSYGLGLAWKNYGQDRYDIRKGAWVAISLMLLLPFAFANKLRFDRFQPLPHFRNVSAEVSTLLSNDDKLIVVDPKGSGESAVIARYEMGGLGILRSYISAYQKQSVEVFTEIFSNGDYSHALIHSVTPDMKEALNLGLTGDNSYLLKTDNGIDWRVVRTWPVPAN